jgi:hypothetical protein
VSCAFFSGHARRFAVTATPTNMAEIINATAAHKAIEKTALAGHSPGNRYPAQNA